MSVCVCVCLCASLSLPVSLPLVVVVRAMVAGRPDNGLPTCKEVRTKYKPGGTQFSVTGAYLGETSIAVNLYQTIFLCFYRDLSRMLTRMLFCCCLGGSCILQ